MGLVTNVEGIAREMGIPIGVNPMKPDDIVLNKSFQSLPPMCPICWPTKVLLYPTHQDMHSGNQLFECLNGEGHYMAVYHVSARTWGQRPGAVRENWAPPTFGAPPMKKPAKVKAGRPRPVPDDEGDDDDDDAAAKTVKASRKKRKVKTRK
jgi:hypothetical protein